jgi:exonuclease III
MQESNFLSRTPKDDNKTNIIPLLTSKITGSNNHWFLISFNINELSLLIKRYRLTDWLHKQHPAFCRIQETHLSIKYTYNFRTEGWKTIFQANGPKKQAGVSILISNKINFQPKVIKNVMKNISYSSKKKKKKSTKMDVVAHAFNPSPWHADAGRFLSLRLAWSTE